jgi:hypothetical protein
VKLDAGHAGGDGLENVARRSGHEQAMPRRDDPLGDARDLLGALAGSEDDLREPLTDGPMVIDPSEPEVLERCMAQNLKEALVRCLRRKGTGVHLVQQRPNLMAVHRSKPLPFVDLAVSWAVISPIGLLGGMITL